MSNTDEQGKQYDEVTEDNVDELIKSLGEDGEVTPDKDQGADDKVDVTGEDKPDEGETDKPENEKPETSDDDKDDEKGEQDKPEDKDKPEPTQVIKTRDGKHEIPYSVLERERREKSELQRQLNELKQQQALAAQQKPEPPKDQDTGASTETDEMSIDAIREEFGDEMAKVEAARREKLARMEARQKELEDEIEANRKWRESQEQKAKQSVESEINEAIDSISELREWRDNADPLWDAAVALDNRLAEDPAYEGKSFRERFEAVVERLTGRKPKQEQDPASTQKALDQKLAESEKASQSRPPSSLSDLPGGNPPDVSEHETLERLTTAQLEAKLSKMTPEQQEEYLARL